MKALLISHSGLVRELGDISPEITYIRSFPEPKETPDTALVIYDTQSPAASIVRVTSSSNPEVTYYKANSTPIDGYVIFTKDGRLETPEYKALLNWYRYRVAAELNNLNQVSELTDEAYRLIREAIHLPYEEVNTEEDPLFEQDETDIFDFEQIYLEAQRTILHQGE